MVTPAADDNTEAMEQIVGEERAAAEEEEAEAVEAMEQVEEEEAEAVEAMEQVEEEEAEVVEAMEEVEEEERAEAPAEEGAEVSDEGHVEAMEQVDEEEEVQAEADEVRAEEAVEAEAEGLSTVLPLGRVKKIMRVDRDIKKVTAEASLLIAAATEIFLGSLAAGAHTAASQRGRRGVRAADVRAAARAHRPTADFLLDCLSAAEEAPRAARSGSDGAAAAAVAPKPLPRGTRRIDGFFQKVT